MARELQGIGNYRLLAVIGEGERAIVYRGLPEDASLGSQEVAVKTLRPALIQDPETTAQMVERAEAAQRIHTPLALSVHKVDDADGRPYVVGQLCGGISLEELPIRRNNGRLKPEQAIYVLQGVLEALACVQEQDDNGLVHGRLDAGDVRIDPTGAIRIAGFGMEGEPETDLLRIARIAQDLCRQWPLSVDAWIDRLQAGEESFGSPREALEALPLEAFAGDVMGRGRQALARAVQRIVKKREPALADKPAEPENTGVQAADAGFMTPMPIPDAGALTQAAGVAWFCAAVVFAAIAVEIIQFGP